MMQSCPQCGRFVTSTDTPFCLNCGAQIQPAATAQAPASGVDQPPSPPTYPYPPTYSPTATAGTPAAPSQPLYGQPPYAQPPYGQSPYGQSPYGQPPYGSAYNASGGYPGAYAPGANWKPSKTPARAPWGRIIAGVVGVLILIAVVASVYTQTHQRPLSPAAVSATMTASAVASQTLLADSLMSNTNLWSSDSHCYFDHDGYHIKDGYICYAPIGVQIDGTQSVTVKQISGPTTAAYGLVFRRVSKGNYYMFGIDSNSKWFFDKVVNGADSLVQDFTPNNVIHGGLNTENTLSVTISGSTFDCFVNGQPVGTIHDSTFPEGKWGLVGSTEVNVVFTNYLAKQ